MKLTVKSRQPDAILKQADELRVIEPDINKILDFIEMFPEKTVIYEMPKEFNPKDRNFLDTLLMYNEKLDDFILELRDARLISTFQEMGLKAYWRYPVNTYFDLKALIKLNPAYIVLGEPLCFELPKVKKLTENIPLRMTANCAYDPYLEREDGFWGKWIRPEDLETYDQYLTAIDFRTDNLKTEEIIFKAYKEGKWLGNLNFLITGLNKNIDNRSIPDNFATRRINCGQKCMENGNCKFCQNILLFSKILSNKAPISWIKTEN